MYNRNHKPKFTLRHIEKVSYAILIPSIFAFTGYKLYSANVLETEKRALELKKVEDKYFKIAA